ncbi:MAG: glycosyltransferase family 4 protein [Deltaproteobacteria bacterium]|jgi:glycosyltransferase involved in cell wall biosynthesis|nr:glycosyltransferase family 4 protein [Deltaproteobacteria bacterium]
MAYCSACDKHHNVGFISTRFSGTDGVSLETAKWASVFEKAGFTCFYFAGEIDRPAQYSYLANEAHFQHPDIVDVYRNCFGTSVRGRFVTRKIYEIKQHLKDHLYAFIEKFALDLLVPENSLTIPLNIPLGIALTEVISETGIPTIAHHHDFFWERQHFMINACWEYLNMAFPPHLPSIQHVVINSSADNQLSLRTGISATIIPNVMDFDNPPPVSGNFESCALEPGDTPPPTDTYAADVRQDLGVADDELLILQPTRVVKRKGIEHAIELVHRLGMKAKLVISHASGDEGYDYERRVREYSKLMKVDTYFVAKIINEQRGKTKGGRKIYTLEDIYPHADLVTYPSNFEGFGNAFLEAIYFCRPIVVNTYSIYTIDIKPKGFSVIEIDGYVTDEAVRKTRKVLTNPDLRKKMVTHNYQTAKKYYSYTVLAKKLGHLLADCTGCQRLLNRA